MKTKTLAGCLAVLLLCSFYAVHIVCCQNSALRFLDGYLANMDMHANLEWAKTINDQGWLNPKPYHPYNDWMQPIAPLSQWMQWWGGEQIFQQSPLYAYLLAVLPKNLLVVRIIQALTSAGMCVLLGLLTARISGRSAGWVAFGLAALYAPFYAYSWPLLRDGLGWFITTALLWALVELTSTTWPSVRSRRFGWIVGICLGLGYLTRESYLLFIPVVLGTLTVFAWKRRDWAMLVRVGTATILVILPLVIRNYFVGAPLLSSSNRFAETFIHGNARNSSEYNLVIPEETGQILHETQGKPLRVVRATIASHQDGMRGWMGLQCLKLLSLLDPYESPDNLSIYFVASISPLVQLGVRYWMILVPGLGGLYLTIRRREYANLWLWLFLPVMLVSLLAGCPLSRYRQSLALLLIPWAGVLFVFLADSIRRHKFRAAVYCGYFLAVGWLLVLWPLARYPRSQYERPVEYLASAEIYQRLGWQEKLSEMQKLIQRKFVDTQQ